MKEKHTLTNLISEGLTSLDLVLEGVLEINATLLDSLHLLFQIGLVLFVLRLLGASIPNILDTLKVLLQLLNLLVLQSLATGVCLVQLFLDLTDLCMRLSNCVCDKEYKAMSLRIVGSELLVSARTTIIRQQEK